MTENRQLLGINEYMNMENKSLSIIKDFESMRYTSVTSNFKTLENTSHGFTAQKDKNSYLLLILVEVLNRTDIYFKSAGTYISSTRPWPVT